MPSLNMLKAVRSLNFFSVAILLSLLIFFNKFSMGSADVGIKVHLKHAPKGYVHISPAQGKKVDSHVSSLGKEGRRLIEIESSEATEWSLQILVTVSGPITLKVRSDIASAAGKLSEARHVVYAKLHLVVSRY